MVVRVNPILFAVLLALLLVGIGLLLFAFFWLVVAEIADLLRDHRNDIR